MNTSTNTPSINTGNPWIGLDSYHEGQALYGRGREVQDLAMAVFYHRHTVVYGRSGIGKSSLLHAGIFPEARRRGCLPISVRFDHFTSASYREQLIRVITDAVTAAGGTMTDTAPENGAPKSLWEFFHRYQPQRDGQPLTPLIVIDQFEEIFTLSKNRQQVKSFFDELADLFNDVMPDYLQSSSIQTAAKTDSLFDGLNLSLADERFAKEMSCHLVFVLREDYLSYLERYSQGIPALKQNRYGVMPITYAQAMEIIVKPREGLVSTEVADAIIRHIVTENEVSNDTPVDAAILSLFLSRLYEKKGDAAVISRQLVEEQGDALLEDFYEEIVAPLDVRTIHFLEDTLINADGHRENITVESLYKNDWLKRDAVAALEHSHLLRVFSYGDVQRVEFAHDVLCPIIVKRRDQRINRARLQRSRRRAIWSYVIVFAVFFLGIVAYEMISATLSEIKSERKKLGEVEASLILKGAQKMLDDHDIYGAIHLLINSIDEALYFPSVTTTKEERLLRQAMDSLRYSKDTCVAWLHYSVTEPTIMTLSRSKRLVAIPDYSDRNFIIDSQTGAIVQAIAPYYPVELFTYDPFSAKNAQKWKYFVRDGQIQFGMHDTSAGGSILDVTDIHPNDSLCLIIDFENAVYECFIRTDWWEDNGHTRLCLHDFQKHPQYDTYIVDAAYNEKGDRISVQLEYDSIGLDSTVYKMYHYLLFDAYDGRMILDDSSSLYAERLIREVEQRRGEEDKNYVDLDGNWKATTLSVSPNSRFLYQERRIFLSVNRTDTNRLNPTSPIYIPSVEQQNLMREHLDTLSTLSSHFMAYTRSFLYDEEDSVYHVGETKERYHWPLAISPDNKRVVLLHPLFAWQDKTYEICGIYPHNGAIFFYKRLDVEVRNMHFTEDNQYVIVNAGDEDEQVIYLPPLQELVGTCRNMFFDWVMSPDDRYQTYLHMND